MSGGGSQSVLSVAGPAKCNLDALAVLLATRLGKPSSVEQQQREAAAAADVVKICRQLLGGIAPTGLVVGQEMRSKSIPRDTIPYTLRGRTRTSSSAGPAGSLSVPIDARCHCVLWGRFGHVACGTAAVYGRFPVRADRCQSHCALWTRFGHVAG